jgi:hypothetical protein
VGHYRFGVVESLWSTGDEQQPKADVRATKLANCRPAVGWRAIPTVPSPYHETCLDQENGKLFSNLSLRVKTVIYRILRTFQNMYILLQHT